MPISMLVVVVPARARVAERFMVVPAVRVVPAAVRVEDAVRAAVAPDV